MKIQTLLLVSIISFFSVGVFAESDTVTGLCKDGTSYSGTSKKGACRGHKGIKEWYGDKAEPASAPAAAKEPAPAASASEAATGLCKDGTPYTGASKKGACRGHKGIKEWYADKEAPTTKKDAPAKAAAPAAAATGGVATGLCKDGTEYTGESKRGACRGHKGVKEWYADKKAAAAKEEVPAKAAPATEGVATGLCKDGTEYTGESKRGACRGHKGVKEWYADKKAPEAKEEVPTKAAPAAATEGVATGLCKDGTEYTGESKRGACRGHKGVKEWYADKEMPAAKAEKPAKATAPAAAAEEETEAPAPPTKKASPAPAAGSGKVWGNTNSKIYHCEGSKFYGNTKEGEYMSEADAQAQGYVANRKKVCN
jgi:hypothetical protein